MFLAIDHRFKTVKLTSLNFKEVNNKNQLVVKLNTEKVQLVMKLLKNISWEIQNNGETISTTMDEKQLKFFLEWLKDNFYVESNKKEEIKSFPTMIPGNYKLVWFKNSKPARIAVLKRPGVNTSPQGVCISDEIAELFFRDTKRYKVSTKDGFSENNRCMYNRWVKRLEKEYQFQKDIYTKLNGGK